MMMGMLMVMLITVVIPMLVMRMLMMTMMMMVVMMMVMMMVVMFYGDYDHCDYCGEHYDDGDDYYPCIGRDQGPRGQACFGLLKQNSV